MKIYIDLDDWWVGLYRGPHHRYVCLLPCVVIRIPRRHPRHSARVPDVAGWSEVPAGCACRWTAVAGGWLRIPDLRCPAVHGSPA